MLRLDGVNMANATQNTKENVVQLASDHVTIFIFSISSLLLKLKVDPLMAVLRPWFGTALRDVFARGLRVGIVTITAPSVSTMAAMTSVATMPTMPTMPEHVHRHKRDKKQNPNPVL